MKKNKYNIKPYYFEVFMGVCEELNTYPEQEMKLKVLTEYLKKTDKNGSLGLVFAYFMDRILTGIESKFYFSEIPVEENIQCEYKINLIQLRYSGTVINQYVELEESIQDFVYSFEGTMQEFLRNYYNCKNITGIRIKDLEELYNKGKFYKLLKEPTLSDFSYDVQVVRKKSSPSPKLPVIMFKQDNPTLVQYVRYEGEVATNLPKGDILTELNGVLRNYNNIAIVGHLENNTLKVYICTSKWRVCKGLFSGERYTIQNSFRYLLGDFKRVNNSIKKHEEYLSLTPFKKAEGRIFYDMVDLLEVLEDRPQCCLLFRNEFKSCPRVKVHNHIITELNFITNTMVTEYTVNKKVNKINISKQFVGDINELEVGTIVTFIEFGDYLYVKKKGN